MTQQEALHILKTGHNVFLTGCAGSGKSHVLTQYLEFLRMQRKKVGITASTGIAATHLGGITIHSWAGIGVKETVSKHDIEELLKRKYLYKRITSAQTLIIDEVSMLSARTLTTLDTVFKAFRQSSLPFGGLKVVLCGDFFQLPPIAQSGDTPEFLYLSPVWESLDLKICYLDKPYRQIEEKYITLLSEIRKNTVTDETWLILKERFLDPIVPGMTPTRLYTHNINADKINHMELAKIRGEQHEFQMEASGNSAILLALKKSCLAPEILTLKKKALVMFVKNRVDEGYVNGTMGRVVDFTPVGYPIVKTFSGQVVTVRPATWEVEEDGAVQARLTQIPLRLAWAITVHKSQGMTLDAAEIDLGKSFVKGMGYVALSRVRSLSGLRLLSINRTALSVHEEVIAYDKKLQQYSASLAEQLS